nr:hypothetical protein [Streptomyces sp. Ag109_O5-1]
MQGAEPVDGAGDGLFEVVRHGDVAGHRERFTAGGRTDPGDHLIELVLAASDEGHVRPPLGEQEGRRRSDAAACARDEGDLAFQRSVHDVCLPTWPGPGLRRPGMVKPGRGTALSR